MEISGKKTSAEGCLGEGGGLIAIDTNATFISTVLFFGASIRL